MPQMATHWPRVCFLSVAPECARCVRAQPIFLRAADARRPDLVEQWYAIMRCVRSMDLGTRCKVLTWQELSAALPLRLQQFLELKYGIDPDA